MIFKKLWRWIMSMFNKGANALQRVDPVAAMQYEADLVTEQVKDGRRGLELYRGLVERVSRQVAEGKAHVAELEAKIKSYLASGDRETAAKFALEFDKAKQSVTENDGQLQLHRDAYENNLVKVKHAMHKIGELRDRIARKDADLRLSRALKEITHVTQALNFDVTTDLGQAEQLIQEEIDANKAAIQVAADLSGQGIDDIRREQDVEKQRAELALQQFETRNS